MCSQVSDDLSAGYGAYHHVHCSSTLRQRAIRHDPEIVRECGTEEVCSALVCLEAV